MNVNGLINISYDHIQVQLSIISITNMQGWRLF